MAAAKSKTAALVLSGGGALGAAHIGAAIELEKAGYRFDFLAGVSAGAIVAALLSSGKSAAQSLDILRDTSIFKVLFDLSWGPRGLIRGKKIHALFESLFASERIEDQAVPLYIGATDFATGERVIIERGSVADALRGSVSVPVVFEPFFHTGLQRWLADGGLSQNLPLDVAVQRYAGDTIITIDVATNLDAGVHFGGGAKRLGPKALKELITRTIRIFLKSQQAALPADARVIKIVPELSGFSALDVFAIERLAAKGAEAVCKALAEQEGGR